MRQPAERAHALDALRAIAMLLVVFAHAAVPYLDLPLGNLPWAIRADAPSALLSHAFWWLHPFLMPLFFVLAGLFAAQAAGTRGPHAFLGQRARRILVPLLAAGVVLLPVVFYVFAAGWWLSGDATWDEIRRVKFRPPIQSELFGPAHLWFLENLFIYCALYWVVQVMRPADRVASGRARRWRSRILDSPWRPLWCAIPTVLILGSDLEIFTTHRNAFVPPLGRFLHFGVFFVIGVLLPPVRAQRGDLLRSAAYLVVSVPLFVWLESLLRTHRLAPLPVAEQLLVASLVALCAWLTIFAVLGLSNALLTGQRASLRHLFEASFWIYLVHLPIVAALQIPLAQVAAPALLKCLAVTCVASALCLWSYGRWVRGTALGALLEGRSIYSPQRAQRVAAEDAAVIHLCDPLR